jgi:hypothetical protein
MLNNEEFDYLNTASTPTVDEVLSAAKFQVSAETSFWNIDVSQVLAAFGHMEACFQYSAKALEIDPKLSSSWAWMGEVYIKRNDWHKAIEMLVEAERIHMKRLEKEPSDQFTKGHRLARKEFETAGAACLDLPLAKIYKDLAQDKAKAVAIWKNVFDSFVDTRDGFPAMIKVLSTNSLAINLLSEAIEVGVGTPEAEEQVAQLEGLSRRLNFTYKSELWVASYCQFFAPGVYYRLAGQDAKFQALFKPGIKQAVEMLSDDDLENDRDGLMLLLRVMIAAGDASRAITMAYHVGHYEVYDEGQWWQLGEEDVVVTCDGPCCISKPMNDGFSFYPICYDFVNCVKLLLRHQIHLYEYSIPKHGNIERKYRMRRRDLILRISKGVYVIIVVVMIYILINMNRSLVCKRSMGGETLKSRISNGRSHSSFTVGSK